jgi:hypothetical protein
MTVPSMPFADFWQGVGSFFVGLLTNIFETIVGIINFIVDGVSSAGYLISQTSDGMTAIRELIECLPSILLFVLTAVICVGLLISVVRFFAG